MPKIIINEKNKFNNNFQDNQNLPLSEVDMNLEFGLPEVEMQNINIEIPDIQELDLENILPKIEIQE